ncbi:MAG: hypothetical protein EBU46_01765 [Nitrosomonadaceae bacterium]|nr:hypothetical protein [Nitrosomonadaceae bacterium]
MHAILSFPVGPNSWDIEAVSGNNKSSATLNYNIKSFAHTIQYFGCVSFLLKVKAIESYLMHSFRSVTRLIQNPLFPAKFFSDLIRLSGIAVFGLFSLARVGEIMTLPAAPFIYTINETHTPPAVGTEKERALTSVIA